MSAAKRDYENGAPRVDPYGVKPSSMKITFFLSYSIFMGWVFLRACALGSFLVTKVWYFLIIDGIFFCAAIIPWITTLAEAGCARVKYGREQVRIYANAYYLPYASSATFLWSMSIVFWGSTLRQWLSYADRLNVDDFRPTSSGTQFSPCTGADATDLCYNREAALATSSWLIINQAAIVCLPFASALFVYAAYGDTNPTTTPTFDRDLDSGVYASAAREESSNAAQRLQKRSTPTTSSRKNRKRESDSATEQTYEVVDGDGDY